MSKKQNIADKIKAFNEEKLAAEESNKTKAIAATPMSEKAVGCHLNEKGQWVVTVLVYNQTTGEARVDFSKICDDRGTAIEQAKIYSTDWLPCWSN